MNEWPPIVPPEAPRRPRGRIVVEWRAPWVQDRRHKRPSERRPPLPEFDAEIEVYLYLQDRNPWSWASGLRLP